MERQDWNRRYEGPGLLWSAQPNAILAAELAGPARGRALDLACGEGRNAVWLAEQGWSVTGADFSDVGLDKARVLAATRGVTVEWELVDLREHQPEPGGYDLVVVLYLHLEAGARRAVHAAAAGALAPGGTLFVLGHDLSNLTDGHGGPPDPSILFTPEDVVADVPGLSVVKAERVVRLVATDDGERKAIDALVRAVRPR